METERRIKEDLSLPIELEVFQNVKFICENETHPINKTMLQTAISSCIEDIAPEKPYLNTNFQF